MEEGGSGGRTQLRSFSAALFLLFVFFVYCSKVIPINCEIRVTVYFKVTIITKNNISRNCDFLLLTDRDFTQSMNEYDSTTEKTMSTSWQYYIHVCIYSCSDLQ